MPPTPSLQFSPATPGDAEAVFALQAAQNTVEIGEPDVTLEDVRVAWSDPDLDLSRDTWLAFTADDSVAGYACVSARTPGVDFDGEVWVHPTAPEATYDELLARLLERAASRATRAGAALHVYALAESVRRSSALARAGFAVARVVVRMRADLPDAAPATVTWPDGFSARTLRQPDDDEAYIATMNAAFHEHFRAHVDSLEAWRARIAERSEFDPALFPVVERGGRIVAVAEAYDFGDIGWIQRLGVLAAHRRRGLGRALLLDAFARFHDRGQRRVELGVDTHNATGAVRLYESAGMRVVHRYDLWRRELALAGGGCCPSRSPRCSR